uniref:Uncharacterized protein n=1 Tax=Rangifer tarandus platyrhynchus TaxID=3082113 RepID=A0ACB0FGI4_RANTA|nr:unnamed protein product [Rangifer tarandus platyrhynchus]
MHMNLRRPPGAAPAAASRPPAAAADDITASRRKTPRRSGPAPRPGAARTRAEAGQCGPPRSGPPPCALRTPPEVRARPHLSRRLEGPRPKGPVTSRRRQPAGRESSPRLPARGPRVPFTGYARRARGSPSEVETLARLLSLSWPFWRLLRSSRDSGPLFVFLIHECLND